MRNEIKYEWSLEHIDHSGDILDSDFSDKLTFEKNSLVGNDLCLVRDEGNEVDGLQERHWAYVKNGKLPVVFADANSKPTRTLIPVRFHQELAKYLS